MKRSHFYCLTFVVVLLLVGISMVSMAEVAVLKIEISDVVSNTDARHIRRLLEPWADPKDITFSTPVDKHGRKRLFTTRCGESNRDKVFLNIARRIPSTCI